MFPPGDYGYYIWHFKILTVWVLVAACRILIDAYGLLFKSCSTWHPVGSPGIEPGPPAFGVWSLNHWTTREVPDISIFLLFRKIIVCTIRLMGFPGGTMVMTPPANAGDERGAGSVPGWRRSLGEGNGNPLQYSCLENSMDRGACLATVYGVAKSRTWLSGWACTHC